jgi:hypothetical protein
MLFVTQELNFSSLYPHPWENYIPMIALFKFKAHHFKVNHTNNSELLWLQGLLEMTAAV